MLLPVVVLLMKPPIPRISLKTMIRSTRTFFIMSSQSFFSSFFFFQIDTAVFTSGHISGTLKSFSHKNFQDSNASEASYHSVQSTGDLSSPLHDTLNLLNMRDDNFEDEFDDDDDIDPAWKEMIDRFAS